MIIKERIKNIKVTKKKVIILAVILLLVLLFVFSFIAKDQEEFQYEEHTIVKGDINVIVEGNGVVSPNAQYNITALVQGDILEDHFEEGQIVKKDDLLYVIESEDLQVSIDRAKLVLQRAQSAYDVTLQTSQLTANSSGTIINYDLKLGQSIMQGQKIAEVLDSDKIRLVLQYNTMDTKDMYIGQEALVVIENGFYNIVGKVSKISSDKIINESGLAISYVEIIFDNPGGIQEKDFAIAKINGITSNNSNSCEFVNRTIIYSTGSGYVTQIYKLAGDFVNRGDVLAVIGGAALDAQVEQASLTLQDAKLALENAENQLKNYNIVAPIDGKILVKNNKKGDVLTTYSMTSPLAIIADMNEMVFTMLVDELDISKIVVGQNVLVKVEALDNKEFTARVDNVNVVGTSINGVATYAVKIVIDEPEGIFPGMNVDSEIQILSVKDTVVVPLSAVKRGNYVYVKANATYQDEDENVPRGYKKVKVEVGKNDKKNIEIISGVVVGDVVLVEKQKAASIMDFMTNWQQNAGDMLNQM